MSRKSGGRKRPAAKPVPATPAETKPMSGWARLSRGTKTLVALAATTAVVTVVPGVIPWVSDRALDLAGVPLVDVDTRFGASNRGLYLAAAETVAEEPGNPASDARFVPAGWSETRLTMEGRRAGGVAVVGMTVEVVERAPVRKGTLYLISPQGESENTNLAVDLDAPGPAVMEESSGAPYFATKHRDLKRGEIWVSYVVSTTVRCECAWRLHVELRYRGDRHEVVVPPAGAPPFRMTAFAADPEAYAMLYDWDRNGVIVRTDCKAAPKACAARELPHTTKP